MNTETKNAKFTVVNKRGIHMRSAKRIAELAASFPCDVMAVGADGAEMNAKSIFEVLHLRPPRPGEKLRGICNYESRPDLAMYATRLPASSRHGGVVEFRASGERADECLAAIGQLFADRLGDPE